MKNKFVIIAILLSHYGITTQAQSLIVVAQKETDMYNQTWFCSGSGKELQTDKIKKYWDEDLYINSVAYTSKGWFVTMAKGLNWTSQTYCYRSSWPDEWVHENMESGYMITSLSSSGSKWLVVMSTNTDYTTQEICSAPWSELSEWILKWWNNDYYITSLTCRNGMWTVVMSKTSLYSDQVYVSSTTASGIKEEIIKKWDAGYRIIIFEYGGGNYLCVMSKLVKNDATPMQSFLIEPSDAKKYIKEKWDESYNVIYVGG